MSHQYAKICADIKGKCLDYVKGRFKDDFYVSSSGENYLKNIEDSAEEERQSNWIWHMDEFLLFGETAEKERVLDVLLRSRKFTKEEKKIIEEWKEKAFMSVFEIGSVQDDVLELFDVVAEVSYRAYSNNSEIPITQFEPKIREKHFMLTNLVSVHGSWFLSGIQKLLPPESEQLIFENFVNKQSIEDIYRNNQEKLARAFQAQKEHHDWFVAHYGTEELIIKGSELEKKIGEYYEAWSKNKVKVDPFPQEMVESNDVGIVTDEKEGLNYFIDYGLFLKTFMNSDNPPDEWMETVLGYLEDESVPAFVFRRMKERYPESFKIIMKKIVFPFKRHFDPVADFDKMIDIFKPDWRKVYPSVHPINERFKSRTYQKLGVGRNEPCPCGSGKKFKKCCLR